VALRKCRKFRLDLKSGLDDLLKQRKDLEGQIDEIGYKDKDSDEFRNLAADLLVTQRKIEHHRNAIQKYADRADEIIDEDAQGTLHDDDVDIDDPKSLFAQMTKQQREDAKAKHEERTKKEEADKQQDVDGQMPLGDVAEKDDLGFSPEAMTERDAELIAAHRGPGKKDPSWIAKSWAEEPIADASAQPLKLEVGGKYIDRFEDVNFIAQSAGIENPTHLMVLLVKAAKEGKQLSSYIDLRLAAFLVDRVCRLQLIEPSIVVRDALLAIGRSGLIETVRRISPLAAAVYESERDLAGKGDGTDNAPTGPQGGSASRTRKRDEAANRKAGTKAAAKKKAGKSAGKSAKSRR